MSRPTSKSGLGARRAEAKHEVLLYILERPHIVRSSNYLRSSEVTSADLERDLGYTRAGAASTLRRLQLQGYLRRRRVEGRRPKGYLRYTNLHGVRRKRRVDRRKKEFLGYAYRLSGRSAEWLARAQNSAAGAFH